MDSTPAATSAADTQTVVIVLDDCETFCGLGDDQDQSVLLLDEATGAVEAFDLARFLRNNLSLLRSPEYRMPVARAIKDLGGVEETFGLTTGSLRAIEAPATTSSLRLG